MTGGFDSFIAVNNGESGTKPLSLAVLTQALDELRVAHIVVPGSATRLYVHPLVAKRFRWWLAVWRMREIDGVPVQGCAGVTRFVWRKGRWKVKNPGSTGSLNGNTRPRRI